MKQILIDLLKLLVLVMVMVVLAKWMNIPDDLAIVLMVASSVFVEDFFTGLDFLYRKIQSLFK